jgi:Autographiviridae endonuclease VII
VADLVDRKTCTRCLESKSLEAFHNAKHGKYGKGSWCIACDIKRRAPIEIRRERSRSWAQRNREKRREHYRKWKDRHPNSRACKRYGITEEDYRRMMERQNSSCAICHMVFGNGRFDKPRIDHCHETGRVRGLLCNGCNLSIGYFTADPSMLLSASLYLAKS